MSNDVIMLCGVPASGKTWVMEQLLDRYFCVPNDYYIKTPQKLLEAIWDARTNPRTIIVDCPFAERERKADLEQMGFKVTPIFIVEHPSVIESRYIAREAKRPSQATLTRAMTIGDRAREWKAQYGTAQEVLGLLKRLVE